MDWIDGFIHEWGGLLGSRRNEPVTLNQPTPPRAIVGTLKDNTLTTTREGIFWMLAADEILRRIDQRKHEEQHHAAQLALIPEETPEEESRNPYRAEAAGEPIRRQGAGHTRSNRRAS